MALRFSDKKNLKKKDCNSPPLLKNGKIIGCGKKMKKTNKIEKQKSVNVYKKKKNQ